MLREQLVSACSRIILDTLRSHRGWLSFISSEAQVNRQYFTLRKFHTLKVFRLVRVLYVMAMKMDRDEFVDVGRDVFGEIWDQQDYLGYELLDENKTTKNNG